MNAGIINPKVINPKVINPKVINRWGKRLTSISLFFLVFLFNGSYLFAIQYPGAIKPGKARAEVEGDRIIIQNEVLYLSLSGKGKKLKAILLRDKVSGQKVDLRTGELFSITSGSGRERFDCSQFLLQGDVKIAFLKGDSGSQVDAEKNNGFKVEANLTGPSKKFLVDWSLELRDGSNYFRQSVEIKPKDDPVIIHTIEFNLFELDNAYVSGNVSGSPVVAGRFFLAYEHPNGDNGVFKSSQQEKNSQQEKSSQQEKNSQQEKSSRPGRSSNKIFCRLNRNTGLKFGRTLVQSAVVGTVPANQLRRGFLYYLERQRAHPYREYLHYNSWYHLNIGRTIDNRMVEKECLDTINFIGRELVVKRGVILDGFVWDDGWDDFNSLWGFQKGFPNGFKKMSEVAAKYGARMGAWLSPWGGYGKARQLRLEYGRQHGYEINKNGFSMAGPKYYRCFRDRCLEMMKDYGVNFFKFDGIGGGTFSKGVKGGLAEDVEAMLRLIGELRKQDPSLYISATTGTWPSPFFLFYTDNIWRQGNDTSFYGVGSNRQKWITYRDMYVYHNIVLAGPLYPLNALMPHGLVIGDRFNPGKMERDDKSISDETWMMFGSGTSLLELYISPGLLSKKNWDVLARAARWARGNIDVLVDTHWIGGDPRKLDIYGYASWNNYKGVIVLRNPDQKEKTIELDIGKVFELPQGAMQQYRLTSPFAGDKLLKPIVLKAGKKHKFKLKPFEVMVFDAKGIKIK